MYPRKALLLLWLMGTSCTTLDGGEGGGGAECLPIDEQAQRASTEQDELVLKSSTCIALFPNTMTADAGLDGGAPPGAGR